MKQSYEFLISQRCIGAERCKEGGKSALRSNFTWYVSETRSIVSWSAIENVAEIGKLVHWELIVTTPRSFSNLSLPILSLFSTPMSTSSVVNPLVDTRPSTPGTTLSSNIKARSNEEAILSIH